MCEHSKVSIIQERNVVGECLDCGCWIQYAMTMVAGKPFYFNPWPDNPHILYDPTKDEVA